MNPTIVSLAQKVPYSSPSDVGLFLLQLGDAEPLQNAAEISKACGTCWPTITEGLRYIQDPWIASLGETRKGMIRCKREGVAVSSLAARIELEGFFLARSFSSIVSEQQAAILDKWMAQVAENRKQIDGADLDRALVASIGVVADEAMSLLQKKSNLLRHGTGDFISELNSGFDAWGSSSPAIRDLLSLANSGESPEMLRRVAAINKYNRIRKRSLCESMAIRFFLHFRDANFEDCLLPLLSPFLDADGLRSLHEKRNQ